MVSLTLESTISLKLFQDSNPYIRTGVFSEYVRLGILILIVNLITSCGLIDISLLCAVLQKQLFNIAKSVL